MREIFATIREAMVRIYARLKGTAIERRVHPEVRTVFDEMLGFGPTGPRAPVRRRSAR